MAAERRLAFGQVAALYDRARPSYPVALADDVIAYAGAQPGDRALEIGAGTGKATTLFAERGLRILALEPSAEMAEMARRNTSRFAGVTVEEVEFERWTPNRSFRLLYAAQAWHWIAPEVRYVRAGEAITEGGALALFWNWARWETSPLRERLEELYGRLAPELGAQCGPGPMRPRSRAPEEWQREWQADLERASGFAEPEWHAYSWRQDYSTAEYLRLLQTHSDHVVLAPSRRDALLDAIGQLIDEAGGSLEIEYVTGLALARRM